MVEARLGGVSEKFHTFILHASTSVLYTSSARSECSVQPTLKIIYNIIIYFKIVAKLYLLLNYKTC